MILIVSLDGREESSLADRRELTVLLTSPKAARLTDSLLVALLLLLLLARADKAGDDLLR